MSHKLIYNIILHINDKVAYKTPPGWLIGWSESEMVTTRVIAKFGT